MTPRSEALAFRIWQYADPLGWDCTTGEVAEAIGVSTARVARVCRMKGWKRRLRASGDSEYWLQHYGPTNRHSPDTVGAYTAPAKLNAERLHDLGVL